MKTKYFPIPKVFFFFFTKRKKKNKRDICRLKKKKNNKNDFRPKRADFLSITIKIKVKTKPCLAIQEAWGINESKYLCLNLIMLNYIYYLYSMLNNLN